MLQTTLTKAITDGLVGAFAQIRKESEQDDAVPVADQEQLAKTIAQAVAPMLTRGIVAPASAEAAAEESEAAAMRAEAEALRPYEKDLGRAVGDAMWDTRFKQTVKGIQKRMQARIWELDQKTMGAEHIAQHLAG